MSAIHSKRSLRSLHLRLVSRLALFTGLAAGLSLLAVIIMLAGEGGADYATIIQSYNISQESLGTVLLITGLLLLALVAFITWLITLYSSFRLAGPLYRFARNLEAAASGESALFGIREEDCLQDVSQELLASVAGLQRHYLAISEALEEVEALLENREAGSAAELGQALARLKEQTRHVRLA